MNENDRDPDCVRRVRAANASALTLDGTNTYVVGRWVEPSGMFPPGPFMAAPEALTTSACEVIPSFKTLSVATVLKVEP